MTPDIKVEEGLWASPPADGDCSVTISTINIDLDSNDQPHDFGEEILVGEVVCDDETWAKFKKKLEAMDNMLACLKMFLRDAPTARKYAEEIVKFCGKP